MLGHLAVLYLFAGGAGAGCAAVCSVLDLAFAHEPFGCPSYRQGPSLVPFERTVDFGFATSFCMLALGCTCLLLDAGHPERALFLFTMPHLTMMTFGSFVLAALTLLTAALTAVRFLYIPAVPAKAVRAAELCTVPVAVAVMTYTGFLLLSDVGVAFWRSWAVPALFALSSLSCGTACVLFLLATTDAHGAQPLERITMGLFSLDEAIIVAEAAVAACLLVQSATSGNPGAVESFSIISQGACAPAWWGGFITCGLAVPLLLESYAKARINGGKRGQAVSRALIVPVQPVVRDRARIAACLAAACIMVGAFCLRFSVSEAGVHRAIEPPASSAPVSIALGMEG